MKATWNGEVIAESNDTIVVEGNHYFPPNSVKKAFLVESKRTTVCPWKGTASYYHLKDSKGNQKENVAWYYPAPKNAVGNIKDYVAFYPAVTVS